MAAATVATGGGVTPLGAITTQAFAGRLMADVAEVGRRLGFLGIEVEEHVLGAGGRPEGLAVVSLRTQWRLDAREGREWELARAGMLKAVDKARAVGAPVVTIAGGYAARGESVNAALTRMGKRLGEVAMEAAGRGGGGGGVRVAVENGGTLARAKEMWMLLEVARGMGGEEGAVCWDLAAGGGEMAGVHTINSRLALVRLQEAGSQTRTAVQRLRGIGYVGALVYRGSDRAGVAEAMRGWGVRMGETIARGPEIAALIPSVATVASAEHAQGPYPEHGTPPEQGTGAKS